MRTQWILDQLWILGRIRIVPVLMFGSWVVIEIWIIDLSSALVGMFMSSPKIFLFFEQSLFKLRCETVIGILLCDSHQACCFLYHLCEILNSGIHIYLFTSTSFPGSSPSRSRPRRLDERPWERGWVYLWTFTFPFPDVVAVSNLNKNIGGSSNLVKKGTDQRICILPFYPPSLWKHSSHEEPSNYIYWKKKEKSVQKSLP